LAAVEGAKRNNVTVSSGAQSDVGDFWPAVGEAGISVPQLLANATFIAASRTFVPRLLAEVRELQRAEHLLRDLLALIHGDGGHYAAKHGLEKATTDAETVLNDRLVELDSAEYKVAQLVEARQAVKGHDCCPAMRNLLAAIDAAKETP
jgi:hypothetical protein